MKTHDWVSVAILTVSAALACGNSDESSPGDAAPGDIADYRQDVVAVQSAALNYRTAMQVPGMTPSACTDLHEQYYGAVLPPITRMQGMGSSLDAFMGHHGAGAMIDVSCATARLTGELEQHHSVACRLGDVGADQAEAARHVDVMTSVTAHLYGRSSQMLDVIGVGASAAGFGPMMSGCAGWDGSSMMHGSTIHGSSSGSTNASAPTPATAPTPTTTPTAGDAMMQDNGPGPTGPGDATFEDIATYRQDVVGIQSAALDYRMAMLAADVGTCLDVHDQYYAIVLPLVTQVAGMSAAMDTFMGDHGGTAILDVSCATASLTSEFAQHDAAACRLADLGADQAEAVRHVQAMTSITAHLYDRASQMMGLLAGSAASFGPMMVGCQGWTGSSMMQGPSMMRGSP